MRTIRTNSAVSGLSRPSLLTLAHRHLGISPTASLFSQINVRDLAKGISAQDQPEVSSLDQNWFQYARTAFSRTKGAAGSSGGIDVAAKERIVKAQREAAMRELPAAMQRQMRTQIGQGSSRSAKGEGQSVDEPDLSKYKTVKDTLDAADPHRATANGGGPSSPSSSAAGGASANRGVVNLSSSLESEEITTGKGSGIHETLEAAPVTPSLSIAPVYISPDAIVTPQSIRTMFMESVQARTVANTALRKYIKALNSRDYALAVAAYDGCREGGLRIDADTYAALLDLLLAAQQLKAGMELYQTMLRDRTPPNTHAYNALMRLCINREAIDTALRLFDEMPQKGRRYDKISYELAMTAISMQPHPVDWQKAVQIFEKATAGAVDANGNSFDADEEGEGADGGAVTNNSEANESITFDDKGNPIPTVSGPKRARRKDLLLRSNNTKSKADITDADEGGDGADYVPCLNRQKQVGGFTAGRSRHGNMATASTYNALMKVYLSMQPFEWRVVYNCYFEMRNSKPKVPITWESYYLVAEAMRRGEASRTRRLITYIDAWIQLTSIGSARFVMGFATYALLIGVAKIFLSAYFTDRVQESQDAGLNVQKELPVGHETIAVGLAGKPSRAL